MKKNIVDSFQIAGNTVTIMVDENPESPREWDNLGIMVCFHRRHNLGDEDHGVRSEDFNGWSEMEEHLRTEKDAALILPLYLYDHSGITMSTKPFSCPWDSGRVGLIYATKAKLREEYGVKRLGAATLRKAKAVLEAEVKTYDEFIRGEVYGYVVKDSDGCEVDSCWGFFGLDYCREEATLAAA